MHHNHTPSPLNFASDLLHLRAFLPAFGSLVCPLSPPGFYRFIFIVFEILHVFFSLISISTLSGYTVLTTLPSPITTGLTNHSTVLTMYPYCPT